MDHTQIVRRILHLIEKAYGKVSRLKKTDPIDEIVRIILSQNTSDKNSIPAFNELKAGFRSWEEVEGADARVISRIIRHAGLEKIKAKRIKQVLATIRRREGSISLDSLKRKTTKEAYSYLISIDGIGPKTASCVLLFSFARPVMPVDTHIFRVSKRLTLIGAGITVEEAHIALTNLVPSDLIYRFHLGIIEHGRKTCKALAPLCGACVVYGLCVYKYKKERSLQ